MNRVRLGVAILLTLVLCSCGTAWLVRSETSRLLKQLDTVQQIAETQPEQAKQAFAEFQNQWAESGGLAGQGAANRCDSFASGTHAGRGL